MAICRGTNGGNLTKPRAPEGAETPRQHPYGCNCNECYTIRKQVETLNPKPYNVRACDDLTNQHCVGPETNCCVNCGMDRKEREEARHAAERSRPDESQRAQCPTGCGSSELRKPGEHWVLLDGGKRVCTHPWHNPNSFDRRKAAEPQPEATERAAFLDWWNSNWPDLAPTHQALHAYLFGRKCSWHTADPKPDAADIAHSIAEALLNSGFIADGRSRRKP